MADDKDKGDWLDSIGGPETGAFPKPGESKKVTAEDPNRYSMRGEVGRGGIGRVLIGFDEHLGRDVAIKELLSERAGGSGSGSGKSTAFVDRFLREARVTGQLEHPHIVPVYELGRRADGTLYYVMKVVRGRTLHEALFECESLEERLQYLGHFANACQAIAYAHSRGVIHRDLKPENIMVDEFGETVVLDWGLAKVRGKEDLRQSQIEREVELLTDSAAGSTVDGSAIGTPSYMSPEQADGMVEEIDERSDVWGLGAVLYELLTGRPPFVGDSAYDIIGQVVSAPLLPVCDVEADAPRELAAVAEKALQRDKDERYISAAELTGEIEAFRSGGRVEAHSYSAMELVRRLLTQNRAATLVALVGVAVLIVVLFAAYLRIVGERDQAVAAREQAQEHLAQALAEKARSAARDRDWAGATLYGAAALERDELPAVRGILMDVGAGWRPRLIWQKRSGNACAAVALSPDGKRVVCPTLLGMPFWDVGSGEEVARINTGGGWLTSAAYSPDGTRVAAASHDKSIRVWKLGQGKPELLMQGAGHTAMARATVFSPDGTLLATGAEDKTIRIWTVGEAGTSTLIEGLSDPVTAIAFTSDGARVVASDRGGRLGVWTVAGEQVDVAVVHPAAVRDLHIARGRMATAGDDGVIRLWDENGRAVGELRGHEGPVLVVRFAADAAKLFSGGSDGTLRVWDAQTFEPIARLDAHVGELHSLAVTTDDAFVVTTGEDKTVRAWRVRERAPRVLAGAGAAVHGIAHSPDGSVVVAGCADRNIRIWDDASGRLVTTLPAHDEQVAAVAFHPTEQAFVSVGHDNRAYMWRVSPSESGPLWLRARLAELSGRIRAVAFSPDGSMVAAGGDDRRVHLWDLTGDEHFELGGHGDIVTAIAFSASGKELVSGSWDRSVRVWDVAARKQVVSLEGHEESVLGVAFAGERVVSASADHTVRVWNPALGTHTRLEGHEDVVHALACQLPWCATASDDGTVRIWDVEAGRVRALVDTIAGTPTAVAFSPDGKSLIVGTAAGAMHRLRVRPLTLERDGLLRRMEKRYGMKLDGMRAVPNPD